MSLSDSWSVYFEKKRVGSNQSETEWSESIDAVFKFDTIGNFWCWFENSPVPSSFPSHISSQRFFRTSCSLERKDPENCSGGRILFFSQIDSVDQHWLQLLLILISSDFKVFGENVNGVVVKCINDKSWRFEVWVKSAAGDEVVTTIQKLLSKLMNANEASIFYRPHFSDSSFSPEKSST